MNSAGIPLWWNQNVTRKRSELQTQTWKSQWRTFIVSLNKRHHAKPRNKHCLTTGDPFQCIILKHYSDVIMGLMTSQITSLIIVYSTVYSVADQRKHQSSASLAFVRGIHRRPVNSPHKGPVTRRMFPFDDVIIQMCRYCHGKLGIYSLKVRCLIARSHKVSKAISIFREIWHALLSMNYDTAYFCFFCSL